MSPTWAEAVGFGSVRELAEDLYQQFSDAGIEVLLDDRDQRPGVMFADADLIGYPHRLVIGEKGIDKGEIEYRRRSASENEFLPLDNIVATVCERLPG